ncbi:MAG: transporter substrate-binding domain-containing protein [Synergistaceae bacterium]|nr:transporter substrate-binding domain-containing protein [Synergistaceae bacterium]
MKGDMTEQEFKSMLPSIVKWSVFNSNHKGNTTFKFYDEFIAMAMALSVGEIDEIEVPKPTGEYIIAVNPEYEISCVMRSIQASFVFGFLKDSGEELRDEFNKAIKSMITDGTLEALKNKYFSKPEELLFEDVEFESFPSAKTIKVAVTGDVPPIDYVTEDDEPAGFNTAILSEISRRLKINIEIIDINAAARTAALTSRRVDAVFWYVSMNDDSVRRFYVPDQVIISEPYYSWDTFVHVKRKPD